MARRGYRRNRSDGTFEELIVGIVCFYVVGWLFLFKTNPEEFWRFTLIGFVILFVILIVLLLILLYKKKCWVDLIKRVESKGYKTEILNFINRFGMEKKKDAWRFRSYGFDQDRVHDFGKVLREKGLRVNEKKLYELLEYYIREKEYSLTSASVLSTPQSLNALTGTEFEHLLKTLFESMGYSVQLIGGVGDQGGDLIANKAGKRFLIQAKRYTGSVGNAAVQQAVAAKAHYDCTTATVVSTGEYTREAIALAKTNQVQLVGRRELQQKLIEYLKESWA